MHTKLAIITTEFLREFVTSIITDFQSDIEFRIFIYDTYKDVAALFLTIPDDYVGVITSGIFPATIIKKSYPNTKKVISYFNSDDAGIYRLFLQKFIKDGAFDLSRVYGDFVEMFGISLEDYLTNDQKYSCTDLIDPIVSTMPLDAIFSVEEREYEKHKRLFKTGKIDFAVTRFSSIITKLQNDGVPVYFPYPSAEYFRNIVDALLQNISILQLKENRPAVINVMIDTTGLKGQREPNFQMQYIALQEALLTFNGNSMLNYILQQTHLGFEVLTNQKTLSEYTNDFSTCKLHDFLAKRLDFNTHIGYGIGTDIYQARINAINAGRETSLRAAGSYLINEKEELIGPLGQPENMTVSINAFTSINAISKQAGLSPLTISRVISAAKSMPRQQITASDLALKLSVTKRSANRFLSALLTINAVEVVGEKRTTTKGRPERIFQVLLDL